MYQVAGSRQYRARLRDGGAGASASGASVHLTIMFVTFATFQPLKSLVKALAFRNVPCGRGAASGHCVARAGGAVSRGGYMQ